MAVDKVYQEIYETLVKVKGAKEAQKQLEELDSQAKTVKDDLSVIAEDLEPWNKGMKQVIDDNTKIVESISKTKEQFSFTDDSGIAIMKAQLEQLDSYISKMEQKPLTFISEAEMTKLQNARVEQTELVEKLKELGALGPVEITSQEQINEMFGVNSELSKVVENMELFGNKTEETETKMTFWQRLKDYLFDSVEEEDNVAEGMEDIGNETEKTKKKASGLPAIFKKMGFAIIGVRSTFAMFRKAVSSALSQNAELSEKFNAIWRAIGNAIAPILERIINAVLTAFSYFNVFLKTLSGGKIDLLANTSKSASSTAGSLKEANKQLAGFDEINNLNDQTSSGGSGVSNPWADVEMDTEWTKAMQDFGNWMTEHWPSIIGLLTGTWAVLKLIGAEKIWGLVSGVALFIIGVGVAIFGVIEFIKDMIDMVEALVDWLNNPTWESFYNFLGELGEMFGDVGLIILGVGIMFGNTTALMIGAVVLLIGAIIQNVGQIVEYLKSRWDWIVESAGRVATGIKQLFGPEWKQGIINIFAGLFGFLDVLFPGLFDSAKVFWKGVKDLFSGNWKDGIVNIFKGLANGIISILNTLIRGVNAMAWPIRKLIVGIGSVLGYGWDINTVSIPLIPRLDTGTNYVPSDQLAMIHKGEAVIPKKFNSQEYFGGNSEMAEKLDVLIEAVNNIDLHPYITVKDVGQASVSYQNSQYRLRGRSLVNG